MVARGSAVPGYLVVWPVCFSWVCLPARDNRNQPRQSLLTASDTDNRLERWLPQPLFIVLFDPG